jgi:Phosphorylase superfamily
VLVCATRTEGRVARKVGRPAVVGIGARRGLPEGRLVSFGLAGGLRDDLPLGAVIDATRVVAEDGSLLWEGGPLGVAGARHGTVLAADSVVDDPAERRRLHERTGADAADMESGPLARSGRLAGCLRAVSDTPAAPLGPIARLVDRNGRVRPRGFVGALAHPRESARALAGVRRALRALQQTVAMSGVAR